MPAGEKPSPPPLTLAGSHLTDRSQSEQTEKKCPFKLTPFCSTRLPLKPGVRTNNVSEAVAASELLADDHLLQIILLLVPCIIATLRSSLQTSPEDVKDMKTCHKRSETFHKMSLNTYLNKNEFHFSLKPFLSEEFSAVNQRFAINDQ